MLSRLRLSRVLPVAAVAVAATALLGTVIQPTAASAATPKACKDRKTLVASQGFVRKGNQHYGSLYVFASPTDTHMTQYCVEFTAHDTKETKVTSFRLGLVYGNGVTKVGSKYAVDWSYTKATPLVSTSKQRVASVLATTSQCVYVVAIVNYKRAGVDDSINWAKSNATVTANRVDPNTWIALCGPGSNGPATKIPGDRRYDFAYKK